MTFSVIAAMRYLGLWLPPLAGWVRMKAEKYAVHALESYRSGDLVTAEARYREALMWNPNDASLRVALGQIYYEAGREEEAENQFRKALDYDYQNLRALQGLGIILLLRDQLDEAMYLYLRYLEIEPRNTTICVNLGVIFHTKGDYEKAIEYYARAEKEAPGHSLALKNHALSLVALGRFEDAATALNRARKDSPKDGEIDRFMGEIREAQGDYEGALGSYDDAIKKNPGDAEAYSRYAVVASDLGRYSEAAIRAMKSVELFRQAGDTAGTGTAYLVLGWAYYMLGDWDRSLEANTESLRLNPNRAPVRFNRALTLLQLGRSAEARQEYMDGIHRLAQETDLKIHAIDDLSNALKQNPNLVDGAEILTWLEEKYSALSRDLAKSAHQSANRATQIRSA